MDKKGCHWICKRDPTNQSEPDYYCKVGLNSLGACDQQCLDCAASLKGLIFPIKGGYYATVCQDGVGHTLASCTSGPANSYFTSNSLVVGDSKGCAWSCNAGFEVPDEVYLQQTHIMC